VKEKRRTTARPLSPLLLLLLTLSLVLSHDEERALSPFWSSLTTSHTHNRHASRTNKPREKKDRERELLWFFKSDSSVLLSLSRPPPSFQSSRARARDIDHLLPHLFDVVAENRKRETHTTTTKPKR
jgi:hypothetical protein